MGPCVPVFSKQKVMVNGRLPTLKAAGVPNEFEAMLPRDQARVNASPDLCGYAADLSWAGSIPNPLIRN